MKYNHQTAVLREKKEAERIVRCCKKAGMSQKKIDEVLEYIHSQYTADRRFMEHSQPLEIEDADCNSCEERNPMHKRFMEELTVKDEYFAKGIDDWLQSLEDPRLITGMKSLNKEQIELLYCVFVEGRSFLEFAELKGISKGAVSQRFRVIKNKLNKNIK